MDLGLTVIANGSLLQGELVGAPALDENYGISGLTGPLQAIQFSRSIPGVTSVLVGMTQPAHWERNASLFALAKADFGNPFSCAARQKPTAGSVKPKVSS